MAHVSNDSLRPASQVGQFLLHSSIEGETLEPRLYPAIGGQSFPVALVRPVRSAGSGSFRRIAHGRRHVGPIVNAFHPQICKVMWWDTGPRRELICRLMRRCQGRLRSRAELLGTCTRRGGAGLRESPAGPRPMQAAKTRPLLHVEVLMYLLRYFVGSRHQHRMNSSVPMLCLLAKYLVLTE